jgi:hypothetical protein
MTVEFFSGFNILIVAHTDSKKQAEANYCICVHLNTKQAAPQWDIKVSTFHDRSLSFQAREPFIQFVLFPTAVTNTMINTSCIVNCIPVVNSTLHTLPAFLLDMHRMDFLVMHKYGKLHSLFTVLVLTNHILLIQSSSPSLHWYIRGAI